MAVAVPLLILLYNLPQLLWPSVVVALTLLVSVFQAPLWVYYRRMEFVHQRRLQAVDPVVGFVVSILLAVAGAGYWSFVGGWPPVPSPPRRRRCGVRRCACPALGARVAALLLVVLGTAAAGRLAGAAMAWGAALAVKLDLGVAAVGVIASPTTW